jgi:hypothetical protein
MRATLQKLVDACHGDERPDCPILDDIAGEGRAAASPRRGARRGGAKEGGDPLPRG